MTQPVFLAAAWSSLGDETLVDKLLVGLQVTSGGRFRAGDVFVPGLHAGEPGVETTSEVAFERTLAALQSSRVVVAVLDGGRTADDVAFLVAYAFAAGKPIIGLSTDRRQVPSHLLRGACTEVVGDVKALGEAIARRLG